jgi:hypothetical protein
MLAPTQPRPMTLADLPDQTIIRLAHRIDHRIRAGYGYQPYGFDWPTLQATRPGLALAYRSVWAEGRRRGL